ncbi:MAG: HEAT repeat domain-containing protein [Leptolyngbyaceae cyanobacterium SL_7_1]|nr:HEAT repeat domain-containing protein [Leptolyngbyaceae cyanobacterium SL_7_1]
MIQVLGYNNPAAAAVAVRGLIQLGEASVLPLLQSLDEYNYGARAYAIRALAAIADPRALEVLVAAAETDFAPSVRRAATKGLGQIRWQANAAVVSAQQRVLHSLVTIAHDADWSLRYAAIAGLQALGTAAADLVPAIVEQCRLIQASDGDVVVQARATLAVITLSP